MGAGGGYQQPMGKGGGYQQPMSYGQPYGGGKGGQRLPQQGPTGPYVTDGQYRPSIPNSGQSPYGPFGGPLPGAGMFDGRRERPEFQPVAEPAFPSFAALEPAFPRFPSAYDRDPASNANIGVPAFRDIPEYRALQDARQRQREEMQNLQNAFRQTGRYQEYMRELPPMRPQKTLFNQDPRGMPSFNLAQLEAFPSVNEGFMPPRRGGSFADMLGTGYVSQDPSERGFRVPRGPQPIAAPVKGGIQPAILTRG